MSDALLFPPVRVNFPQTVDWIRAGFGAAELARIESLRETLVFERAKTVGAGDGAVLPEVRNSRVAWVSNDATWGWLYSLIYGFVLSFNVRYEFGVWGFVEQFQVLEYGPGDMFDYHVDDGIPGVPPRKLSITVQLSDPASYEGGDLEIWGSQKVACDRCLGTIICFPSYTLHRVTPVKRGLAPIARCVGERTAISMTEGRSLGTSAVSTDLGEVAPRGALQIGPLG